MAGLTIRWSGPSVIVAAPCARWQLVREPVRGGSVVRPLNSSVRQRRVQASCPRCKGGLPWQKLRSEFSCPHCEASLTAHRIGPIIAAIILWTIADIPVVAILYSQFGKSDIVVLARAIVSGLVGWGILSVVVGGFTRVEALSNNKLEMDRET